MQQSEFHHTAPDTYWEGAEEVSIFTTEPVIVSGYEVTTQSMPMTVVLEDEQCS